MDRDAVLHQVRPRPRGRKLLRGVRGAVSRAFAGRTSSLVGHSQTCSQRSGADERGRDGSLRGAHSTPVPAPAPEQTPAVTPAPAPTPPRAAAPPSPGAASSPHTPSRNTRLPSMPLRAMRSHSTRCRPPAARLGRRTTPCHRRCLPEPHVTTCGPGFSVLLPSLPHAWACALGVDRRSHLGGPFAYRGYLGDLGQLGRWTVGLHPAQVHRGRRVRAGRHPAGSGGGPRHIPGSARRRNSQKDQSRIRPETS